MQTCHGYMRVCQSWERTCVTNDDLEVGDSGCLSFDALRERLEGTSGRQLRRNEVKPFAHTVGVIMFAGSSMS